MSDVDVSKFQDDAEFKPVWKYRRRVIFLSLIFCAVGLSYIVLKNSDSELHKAALWAMSMAAMGIIGSYAFGATWDANGYRTALMKMRTGGK